MINEVSCFQGLYTASLNIKCPERRGIINIELSLFDNVLVGRNPK